MRRSGRAVMAVILATSVPEGGRVLDRRARDVVAAVPGGGGGMLRGSRPRFGSPGPWEVRRVRLARFLVPNVRSRRIARPPGAAISKLLGGARQRGSRSTAPRLGPRITLNLSSQLHREGGGVAQRREQASYTRRVGGSNPPSPTKHLPPGRPQATVDPVSPSAHGPRRGSTPRTDPSARAGGGRQPRCSASRSRRRSRRQAVKPRWTGKAPNQAARWLGSTTAQRAVRSRPGTLPTTAA